MTGQRIHEAPQCAATLEVGAFKSDSQTTFLILHHGLGRRLSIRTQWLQVIPYLDCKRSGA